MMREPGFLHYPINLGLAGKVGNVELAAADRLYIGQRGPDEVSDTGILGSAYRRCGLLKLVGTLFPIIRDFAMLVWVAAQSAHLELTAVF
ncbi:MAG: hypothetical protein QOE39_674 [Bradyrhizobium sp.]|nr:hypothetical protein [Bradyrhizobium sp.]